MTTKRALIFGISGQDGVYLSRLLLDKGYEVHGTSRDVDVAPFEGLKRLGVFDKIRVHSANLTDYRSVIETLHIVRPDEIYNLSAQSSVGLSFDQPIETLSSIGNATLNLLEAIRFLGGGMRLYSASTSEMFGDTGGKPADELTAFRPHSPYGVSKAAAHWFVEGYRKGYSLYACSGICFNHESPLRNMRFVTQKIVRTAVDIKQGDAKRLKLGNISIVRDWGWAPEYVEAMWRMLQRPVPEDFVIATGTPASLEDFTRDAFACLELDWREHVDIDDAIKRPYELAFSVGSAAKAERELNWKAAITMPDIVGRLVEGELARRKTAAA
jgi:GDPmannose 4,6-dehydratase